MFELAIRITIPKTFPLIIPTTETIMADLQKYNSKKKKINIVKCLFIFENTDMNGLDVKPHVHGYIKFDGISLPTFRKIFKIYVLKIEAHVKQKKGNALYSVQSIKTTAVEYLSYMNKEKVMEIPDYYTQNTTWFGFSLDEYVNVRQSWLNMKSVKTDFKANRKFLTKSIQKLHDDFNSSPTLWTKNRHQDGYRNLTLEYLTIYMKAGVQWKRYQVESKINLWWFMKYPTELNKYVYDLF